MTDITFFTSPIGLGHASRDVAIMQELDELSVNFVTGSNAVPFLQKNGFSVEDLYMPPNFDVENGLLQNSLKWLWKYYKYYKDCKKKSLKAITEQKPKLVISDEDFASLTIAQEQKLPTILITDVLETRFTSGFGSIIEKKMNQSMRDIIKKCDMVIMPESGKDEDNIKRVGPIVRSTKFSRDELREKFSFNKKTIVVSIGGTDAGKFLIEKTIEAISKINKEDLELIIVSGPSVKNNYDEKIRNLGFVDNLHEVIFASDLIISLAGNSTIDESKAYGTPGIFIPIKDHFEQEDNAKEEGYTFDDVYRLDELILEKLSKSRNPINFDGTKKMQAIIKNILQ